MFRYRILCRAMNKLASSILFFLAIFLLTTIYWVDKNFGTVTLDQIYSVIFFDYQATLYANDKFLISFLVECIFLPIIIVVMLANFLQAKISRYLSLSLLILSAVCANYQFGFATFIRAQFNSGDFYQKNYINPSQISVKAHNPKNLLLIYVESFETTYSNTNIFQKDLLKQLNNINTPHISFSHYEQMPGTSWSIAGIVGTQCGLPLKLNANIKKAMFVDEALHVLPNAKCLGDILAEHGYKNIYMNGSLLNFTGFGPFFKDHHYSELYGREHWIRSGILQKSQMTTWGMPDDMLLMVAKLRLEQLIKADKPFNLTLFLNDTHGIEGQLSPTCRREGFNDFQGIVECTANQVARFVTEIEREGWLANMNIIIVGDHLAMKNRVSNLLSKEKNRSMFNMIISEEKFVKNTEYITPFDMLPTILTSLGFQYSGNKLGLGYSAIGLNTIGLKNRYRSEDRIESLKKNLLNESSFYDKLWHRG